MAKPTSSVHLLWGQDAFLLREAARVLLDGLRASEVEGGDWQGGELQDLATPSLFGEPRGLLITNARDLPKEAIGELAVYCQAPDPDAPLVVCCTVADRGKPPAALLKALDPAAKSQQIKVERKELEPWLVHRARSQEIDLTPPAARALIDTLGEDTAQLASATEQLGSAFVGEKLTAAHVHRQFRGLGEQKTWDLCDKAFGKDLPGAIRALRSLEEAGDDALKTLGGISTRLRDLIRVRALPDRVPPAQVAKAAGLRFDWQARRYQQQVRNFSMVELVQIHGRIVEADRALKSGATGDVIMPTLIASIATG